MFSVSIKELSSKVINIVFSDRMRNLVVFKTNCCYKEPFLSGPKIKFPHLVCVISMGRTEFGVFTVLSVFIYVKL